MEIDGGGWTFVTVDDLRNGGYAFLNNIQKNKTKVLYRLLSISDKTIQPYTLIEQLNQNTNYDISTQINENIEYAPTQNSGSYVYNGLIKIVDTKAGDTYGFKSNGQEISFTNCDGNPNSYFVFFNPPVTPASYGYSKPDVTSRWRVKIIFFSNFCKT